MLHQLLPDHIAIIHNGHSLSYRELGAQARTVARRLGPRPGVVEVAAAHAAETIAELFGIWLAGGVYCPIDPAFPAARKQAMSAALRAPLMPGDPAYILFTSGSTGEPKPVVTPHRAIKAVVPALCDLFGLTPADRVLQFASLNWDTCFEEILPALTAGATLVFDDEAYTGSFPRFLRLVERQQITVLDLPTAFWHELVHHLAEDRLALPSSVRLVIIGGETVSTARLADWSALDTGHARLLNTYGCTETTLITHATYLDGSSVPAPIGRALPHVVEHISDEGELVIGGPSVALGYLGMRSARFADGVFHTGDRVRRLPDGALVLEGRVDNEIKVRGIRVDPAEVEARIADHPGVSAVAVTGVTVADHTSLAAFVVPRQRTDSSTLEKDLFAFLRERVPGHLVPSRISIVPELAYNANGKVDRRSLQE